MIRKFADCPPVSVWTHPSSALPARTAELREFACGPGTALSRDPAWLTVFRDSFGQTPFALEARAEGRVCGFLPLVFVNTPLFGRFLVSLPYLNSNGVVAGHPDVQAALVSRAVELADELGARHLELRHEAPVEHPALNGTMTTKVHMRLGLPATAELLWKQFDSKLRNGIRKGEKANFGVRWGGVELLAPFYAVLSKNMRDLGTPVYGKELFVSILSTFPDAAELCVVTDGETPVAAALLLHGHGVTEVPTASSLKEYNATNANTLMYRHLLERAVGRGQTVFDFGRSTLDGSTYKFKKQWGAKPTPATWQYYVRNGDLGEMRPDNPRYQRLIRVWQKLPVKLTQLIGPRIVRGIP